MPCIPIAGGFVCTGRRGRHFCSVPGCTAVAVAQCDYPIKRRNGHSGSCSRYLCAGHKVTQGQRQQAFPFERVVGTDTIDYCPIHDRMAKGLLP
jgi:hypothetical protein